MHASSAPIWRRNVSPMSAPSGNEEIKTLKMKSRQPRRSHGAVTLLPITAVHEIAPGAMDVDVTKTRVVYLAPLTCTAAEKYFARTKNNEDTSDASDESNTSDEEEEDVVKNQSSAHTHFLSPVNPLLANILTDHDRRMATHKAKQEKLSAVHVSVFDQRSSFDDLTNKRPSVSPVRAKPRSDRQEDEQIERLRSYIHSMPVTEEDLEKFKRTMKTYQQLQMEYRKTLIRSHASPITFNMEAAWNKKLLEERHRLWVVAHDERFLATRVRKLEEDERYERRIQETTTEHRSQMRLLREVRLRLMLESQMILPTIMLAVATQNWFAHLQRHWRQEILTKRLRGIIRFWCKQRKSRGDHAQAAHLLINWLQKSVAVKSVAFRVFRGIRNYVRRVKKIQRLWKVKQAKRLRNYLMLQKLWIEQETMMVDQANDDFDKNRAKQVDAKPVRNKKKSKAAPVQPSNAAWLTFVSAEIRMDVIKEYVREQEVEFTRLFRHQEEDLYPQLVQTLRDENPNKARSYIKAVANGHALLGRVYVVLSDFPGAVVGVAAIESFDIKRASVEKLIWKARDRSPPDETGARFGA